MERIILQSEGKRILRPETVSSRYANSKGRGPSGLQLKKKGEQHKTGSMSSTQASKKKSRPAGGTRRDFFYMDIINEYR